MLSGAGGASGSTSGSTSGGASGSRKSPKCIFVQRIWYRIVRDAFGDGSASGSTSGSASGSRKLPESIKERAERSVKIGLRPEHSCGTYF